MFLKNLGIRKYFSNILNGPGGPIHGPLPILKLCLDLLNLPLKNAERTFFYPQHLEIFLAPTVKINCVDKNNLTLTYVLNTKLLHILNHRKIPIFRFQLLE